MLLRNMTHNNFLYTILVHELEPKKNGYLAPAGGQNIIYIFSNLKVSTF